MRNINRSHINAVNYILLIIIVIQIVPAVARSEAPTVEWSSIYGGEGYDLISQVIQTNDNGYALVGLTESMGEGGGHDCWLVKTDQNGTMKWHRYYGGEGDDNAYDILQAEDQGYAIVGFTTTFDGDYDVLLIKTNSEGEVGWYKTFGEGNEDQGTSLICNTGDGYIITGFTDKLDEKSYDFLLIKTDEEGNELWIKTYGGSLAEKAWSLIQTFDGGYAFTGYTESYGSGGYDFWLVKTDSNGTMEWNRTYGGKDDDVARSLIQIQDGGYVIGGYTTSYGSGGQDFWLVKTDSNGTMEWNRTYGGKDDDAARSLIQIQDGSFVLAGYSEIIFYYNFLLLNINHDGYVQWSKNYSGFNDIFALSLIQSKDRGFAIGGYILLEYNNSCFFLLKTNESSGDISNLSPVAYAGNDDKADVDKDVVFNGNGHDPDGAIIRFRWDFDGDGVYDWESNETGITTHIYNSEGTYNALLEVTDNSNLTSTDMKKITILSNTDMPTYSNISRQIWVIVLGLLIILITTVSLVFCKNRRRFSKYHSLKFFYFLVKMDKWIGYLILSFIFMIGIKSTLSFLFTNPLIFGDEFIYGVVAGDIFHGNAMIFGYTPFSTASPPAGYSYLLAPAYLLGNNMDCTYHGMLLINSILSSLVIFPVYFIMKNFVNKKLSFITAILVAFLPTITTHNYLLMSENAFYPLFLLSCFFLIKTFTYDNFDKKFIFYSLLLGISVVSIIFIRALGIAMLSALLCVFILKLVKHRNRSILKYGLIFLPFLPFGGYLLYKGGTSLLGYPSSAYISNISLIFSNFSHFIRFLHVMINEISYFVIMSYIIFMAFTIFLLFHWKNIPKEKKSGLYVFSMYGLISAFFLIIITSVHMLEVEYSLYTRYVNIVLPIFFMLGVIGMDLFLSTKNRKVVLHLSYIVFLLGIFFIFIFPTEGIKIINSIDVSWVIQINKILVFDVSLFIFFKIFFVSFLIIFVFLVVLKWFFSKNIFVVKKPLKLVNILFAVALCISFALSVSSASEILYMQEKALNTEKYEPARWFMLHDPNAYVIMEGGFDAYSGAGMLNEAWLITYGAMYFWLPDGHVELSNRNNLSWLISSGEINADYILSTHDLTKYYPSVEDIYMNIHSAYIKSQQQVDWHIYRVE